MTDDGKGTMTATTVPPDDIAVAGVLLPPVIVWIVTVTVTVTAVTASVPIARGKTGPLPLDGKIVDLVNVLRPRILLQPQPPLHPRLRDRLLLLLLRQEMRQAKRRSKNSSWKESRLGKQRGLQRLLPPPLLLRPRQMERPSMAQRRQVSFQSLI
jgi:hypothetical protein